MSVHVTDEGFGRKRLAYILKCYSAIFWRGWQLRQIARINGLKNWTRDYSNTKHVF